jgi:hypothetical protein
MFLPVLAGLHSPLEAILTQLPLGWFHFLKHNWPQITWNWRLIATGVVCSAVIVVLGQWLLNSLFKHVLAAHPSMASRPWRWRWTLSGYAALWLLFIIAFGAAGVFRHATWLMSYPRPWYEIRPGGDDLRMVDGRIALLATENRWDLPATRRAFLREEFHDPARWPLAEDYEVLFYGDQSNHLAAYVILRRNWPGGMKKQFDASDLDTTFMLKPISELPQTISNLDATFKQE